MEATVTYKKKIIDLKEDTFKSLSVMAARQGTNLKKLIENLLDLRHVSLSGAQRTGIRQEDGKEPAKERYITNLLYVCKRKTLLSLLTRANFRVIVFL